DPRGLVDVARVQVGHLRLGDPLDLLAGQATDLHPVRLARPLVEPQRLLDQDSGRRRLRDEREGAVLEDGDLDRGDAAVLVGRLRIECLTELHDVDAVLPERGPDRRGRVRLAAGDLELDQSENFLRHLFPQSSFLTLSNPTSTGTCRSKMFTITWSFCPSGLTSVISPSKSASGPEVILTDSPSWNSTCERCATAAPAPVWRMRSTSGCESGTGVAPAPTKPVTPGVFFTTVQASSLRSMLTSTYPGSVRFSACTFWQSFVSITCSVGTTTRRKRGRWFIDSIRCSRLAFTLFSCPE